MGSLTALGDGAVLLQFLYNAASTKNPHLDWYRTEGLRAIISHDEGKTWENQVYVIGRQVPPGQRPSGGGAYLGDSLPLADGKLLTTSDLFGIVIFTEASAVVFPIMQPIWMEHPTTAALVSGSHLIGLPH